MTPLRPWVAVKDSGSIVTAHCNCTAGLLMLQQHFFSVVKAIEMLETTCTSKPCEWIKATKRNDNIYMEGCDIDLSTPSKKFKTLGKENRPPNTLSKSQVNHKVCATTEAEQLNFLKMLHETGSKSAVLQLVSGYCQLFAPKSIN